MTVLGRFKPMYTGIWKECAVLETALKTVSYISRSFIVFEKDF